MEILEANCHWAYIDAEVLKLAQKEEQVVRRQLEFGRLDVARGEGEIRARQCF